MQQDVLELFSPATAEWFTNTFGEPTDVQKAAWPAIAAGKPALVSAPTGTGKTLSAFLIFIDRLNALARAGELKEELYLIYISPLKSLAGDIRENLRRPLLGIPREEGQEEIQVGIRTGDTPQKDRQRMIKHPPHILITTPESLFLMLTSKNGRSVLKTARALIIDELHALIDTKRGAHLRLSVARLDRLCGTNLQRIGLSATIEPLELAAAYLSPEPVQICAPSMKKQVRIQVIGTAPAVGRRKDPVWEELGMAVYRQCLECRSVIAFSEGRRYAEKLAYYVNLLGGDGFARVHHGSLSKEQRAVAEQDLREGRLRLLCATSSMELGIDVGDVERVLQVGCPRTISSTMQRLGRAGHNPGRVSEMLMYPRTASEAVYCGMTAQVARLGGVEQARPPRMCLDVLAQHLVSMAAGEGYSVEDVLEILKRAYSFRDVTAEDVRQTLEMLAGDYEHDREIPVRPRVLYDRIHGLVAGDNYSRMLATAAGGTIPDKGLYVAKTEDGVTLGELDEEFVYESQIGDKFMLGSFGWRIVRQDKDSVIVTQAPAEGARLPFWKGETKGRSLRTSLAFGRILRELERAESEGKLPEQLGTLGLDEAATEHAAGFIRRQIQATGGLPDDRTIIVEHFRDSTGSHQVMVHALFGRRVNAPLSLLVQRAAVTMTGMEAGCVDEEEGFLLYPYGKEQLPEGLLYQIDPERVRPVLEALLPETPLFAMSFRYNAARALMMGMRHAGRQPLWMQRLRSAEMLSSLIETPDHPLIRETKRECLEDQWDIDSAIQILNDIRAGLITVREIHVDIPSPMSLPFQWQVETAEMYEYSPTTSKIRRAVSEELKRAELVKPPAEELSKKWEHRKLPENEEQLHALLMMEGDLAAGELEVPAEWLDNLARRGLACYLEPGIWVAAEQREEYEMALGAGRNEGEIEAPDLAGMKREDVAEARGTALGLAGMNGGDEGKALETALGSAGMNGGDEGRTCGTVLDSSGINRGDAAKGCGQAQTSPEEQAVRHIVRRLLYYRGGQTAGAVQERYFLAAGVSERILNALCASGDVVEDGGVYYHGKLYERAREGYIRSLRTQTATQPPEHFAALAALRAVAAGPSEEQLKQTVARYCGRMFPVKYWESVLFPKRIRRYSGAMLDKLLAEGDYFWRMTPEGNLCFCRYEDIDWDAPLPKGAESLEGDELLMYRELARRGASFLKFLTGVPKEDSAQEVLLRLAEKGLVCADSFVPVRQWQNREKVKKATARQRVNARVMALSAGRWDVVRPVKQWSEEAWLEAFFTENGLLCRETFRKSLAEVNGSPYLAGGAERGESGERQEKGERPAQMPDHMLYQTAEPFSWKRALELLRIWEYTGRIRRGYFVAGLSGAQFIRREEYDGITAALKDPAKQILWLNGTDPAVQWGKSLEMPAEQGFLAVPGTAVALSTGRLAAVMERQGKILRVYEPDCLEEVLTEFVRDYRQNALFAEQRRITVKEYPREAGETLRRAGFMQEMGDFVLYR